jgi:DNA-binding XRE family transcriptional regulator
MIILEFLDKYIDNTCMFKINFIFLKLLVILKFAMKTEIDQYVIDKVLKLRKEQHLSQNDLASFIEVSKSFISAVENPRCRAKYNVSHLNEIAKVLNCKFSDFFPPEPL